MCQLMTQRDKQKVRVVAGQVGTGRVWQRWWWGEHLTCGGGPIPRSNWLAETLTDALVPPPLRLSTSKCMYVCVCVCEGAGRLKRATEAGSNSKPNELAALALTHTPRAHTPLLSSAPALASTLGHRRGRRERGERGEAARGRERRGEEGDWRGVRGEHHGFRSGAGCDAAMDYITTGCGHRGN